MSDLGPYCFRAHPAISHCGHLLLKCIVATNICYWLKYSLGGSKLHICEKVFFDPLLDFQILLFIPSHIIIVQYKITLWVLDFFNTIRVSNSLDPDQARQNWAGLISKKLVDTTFWLKSWLKLILFDNYFFH